MHPLIIDELEPPNATIRFEGPTLPEEALTERVQINTATHHYPGAREATIQVLTVQHRPITITGLFSDRETKTPGLADAYRDAIRQLARRANPIRLLYRNLLLEGVITRADFTETDPHETRYEIDIEITSSPTEPNPAALQANLATKLRQRLAILVTEANLAYEQLPAEIRISPNPDIETTLDTATPERIAIEFELDPWLEARLDAEALFRAARNILELIGNETALNIDDKIRAGARTAAVAVNKIRFALAEWDGSPLGLAATLTDARNINAASSSVQNIGLIF